MSYHFPIPTELAFEPIQLCNAACFMCPYTWLSKDKEYRGVRMTREQIKILIEDYAALLKKYNANPWTTAITPWRYSDPLVCPDLEYILELANEHKMMVNITTNGVSFTEKNCKIIQKYLHLLDQITISVIGFDEAEIKEFMGVSWKVTKARLMKVKQNFPEISRKMVIGVKHKNQKVDFYPGKTNKVLVWIHGGGWIFSGKRETRWIRRLGRYFKVNEDVNIFSIGYRYGRNTAPQAADDVLCAYQAIANEIEVRGLSKDDVTIMGLSAGGHLALLAGFKNSGDFSFPCKASIKPKAIINFFGIVDIEDNFNFLKENRPWLNYINIWVPPNKTIKEISTKYSPIQYFCLLYTSPSPRDS